MLRLRWYYVVYCSGGYVAIFVLYTNIFSFCLSLSVTINPLVVDLGSSGKSRPVRVILLNHILLYLALTPSSLRLAPTAAALALLSCKLPPWHRGQDRNFETEVAIWTFPPTEINVRRRMIYLRGLLREVSTASDLSDARWSSACGVGGRR